MNGNAVCYDVTSHCPSCKLCAYNMPIDTHPIGSVYWCLEPQRCIALPLVAKCGDYCREFLKANTALLNHKFANAIRTLLADNKKSPPYQKVISSGIFPKLMSLLDSAYWSHPEMLIDISWIFINLSGAPRAISFQVGNERLIEQLLNCLTHSNTELVESCVWVLSNLCVDSVKWRDFAINNGLIDHLLRLINQSPNVQLISWCLSNVCAHKPHPRWTATEVLLYVTVYVYPSSNCKCLNLCVVHYECDEFVKRLSR